MASASPDLPSRSRPTPRMVSSILNRSSPSDGNSCTSRLWSTNPVSPASRGGARLSGADCLGRLQRAAAGEDAQPTEERARFRGQQVVTPSDGGPQGLVARRAITSATGEDRSRDCANWVFIACGDSTRTRAAPARWRGVGRPGVGRSPPRRPHSPGSRRTLRLWRARSANSRDGVGAGQRLRRPFDTGPIGRRAGHGLVRSRRRAGGTRQTVSRDTPAACGWWPGPGGVDRRRAEWLPG